MLEYQYFSTPTLEKVMNFYIQKYNLDGSHRIKQERIKEIPNVKPKLKELELQSDSILKLTFQEDVKINYEKLLTRENYIKYLSKNHVALTEDEDNKKKEQLENILDIRMILNDDHSEDVYRISKHDQQDDKESIETQTS